jgi:hypothetical protein
LHFQTHETDDGDFELILDGEGIDFLEQGLTELRYLESGSAVASPLLDSNGVARFRLKRVADAD